MNSIMRALLVHGVTNNCSMLVEVIVRAVSLHELGCRPCLHRTASGMQVSSKQRSTSLYQQASSAQKGAPKLCRRQFSVRKAVNLVVQALQHTRTRAGANSHRGHAAEQHAALQANETALFLSASANAESTSRQTPRAQVGAAPEELFAPVASVVSWRRPRGRAPTHRRRRRETTCAARRIHPLEGSFRFSKALTAVSRAKGLHNFWDRVQVWGNSRGSFRADVE